MSRVDLPFRTGEEVSTPRLLLKAAQTTDLPEMPWLAAALSPDWEMDDLAAHVEADEAILVRRADGRRVGLVVVVPARPLQGAACIPFVAIDPEERFRGLGGEAALAAERRLRQCCGVKRVFAGVPERRGLGVYFWLRLGYRPLVQAEAPWPPFGLNGKAPPGIWMARDSE